MWGGGSGGRADPEEAMDVDVDVDDSADDDDDDAEESRRKSIEMALAQHKGSGGITQALPYHDDDDEDDDDDDSDEDEDDDDGPAVTPGGAVRGKPEAMAAKLASAARLQEKMDELEAEAEVVAAEPVDDDDDDDDDDEDPLNATMDTVDTVATIETTATTTTQKPTDSPRKKTTQKATQKTTPKKKKSAATAASSSTPGSSATTTPTPRKRKATPLPQSFSHPTMEDPVKPISQAEYENLERLMVQFCRVPLLAEFSRPVALLHPELMTAYSKIVEHPVDLGFVCRKVRKREYASLRDVQLDAWRIFSNCVRYHSHHSNKEAVPSFVSIALHLRNYFNALWQEHILQSDPPKLPGSGSKAKTFSKTGPEAILRAAFTKRQDDRKKRLIVSGLSVMTGKCLARSADTLGTLIQKGGCVDKLDTEPLWGEDADEEEDDLDIVVENLTKLKKRLKELSESGADYGIDELERDVTKCYTQDVLESNPGLRIRIKHRLDRWIGKIVVPIYEATCRGVSQSSVWGCMAASVWARESSKKPFWPALVLGILAPEHQREEWHLELTRRNESRLPGKLKTQLITGKRKAEASLKKQKLGQMEPQSFFLVEFLGTHEFIWVREADIVEDFDPAEDPNQHSTTVPGSKKRKSSRSNIANIIGSKTYASAIEEAQWALEEFENQLQDEVGDTPEDEDEGYSYAVLCQSDDEADEIDVSASDAVDVEELNELLATDGIIDFTTSGRKNAKRRVQALKRQKIDEEKKLKADKAKKLKTEQNKKRQDARAKERESKKEQRELDKKRRKRAREREKALKSADPTSNKKRKLEPEDLKKTAAGRRNLIASKRERATAIVEGYLNRTFKMGDYQTLCLGGVMKIPAAVIDSTGLLGMAMAFRAAAAELPMPEESGVQSMNTKPWDALQVESKKLSSERVDLLKQQAELLEKEIARLKEATVRRKGLAEQAHTEHAKAEAKVEAGDKAARDNPLKKRKTPMKAKGKPPGGANKSPKTPASSAAVSEADAESTAPDAETASNDGGDDIARVMYAEESSGDEAMNESVDYIPVADGAGEDEAVVATAVEVDSDA